MAKRIDIDPLGIFARVASMIGALPNYHCVALNLGTPTY